MDKVTTTKIKIRGDNSKIGTLSSVDMRSSYITCDIINSENITQLSTAPYIYKTNYIDNNKSNISYIGDKKTMSLIPSTNELYIIDDPSEPSNRPLPIFPESGRPTLNVGSARTYTTVAAAITAAQNGDLILLDEETFTITSSITINKRVEIRGTSKLSKITSTSALNNGDNIIVTSSGCLLNNLTIENPNSSAGGAAGCINNQSADIYIDNVDIVTNEFGFKNIGNNRFQLSNNNFKFTGAANTHRYISLTGATGVCIVDNNTFEGCSLPTGATKTIFVLITTGTYTNLSELRISNNTETTGNEIRQFFLIEINPITTSLILGINLFFLNNVVLGGTYSGIFIFLCQLNALKYIIAKNNKINKSQNALRDTGLIKYDLNAVLTSTIVLLKDNTPGVINNPSYASGALGPNNINDIAYNTYSSAVQNPLIKVYNDNIPIKSGILPKVTTDGTTTGFKELFYNPTTDEIVYKL